MDPYFSYPKPELLAPAGSREALEAVVEAGADAVYLSGKRFAMRQHAHWLNFDEDGLRSAARFLHGRGRKLYVTLNNLYTDAELDLLPDYLEFLVSLQPDGLIVTDLGLVRLLRRLQIGLPLFSSVMMQIHNAEGVRELQGLGFRRIVASQHMPLDAIARLRDATGIEIEHFIHGDSCSSVHSLCTHSGIASGEHSGRGKCLKSCRWAWDFVSLGDGKVLKNLERDIYALARKDLCLYKQLPRLIQAGVASFKIEGRARSGDFLRPIVTAYRQLIDDYCADPAAYVFDARVFRQLNTHRLRDFSSGSTFGNPARAAAGLSGEREPRFFSIAIEEQDIALVEQEEFAAQAQALGPFPEQPAAWSAPALTVRCGTPEAAHAALEAGADRVLIGGEVATGLGQRWTLASLRATAARARERGRQALLATPRLATPPQVDEYRWLLGRLALREFDGIHVHNLGLLALARTLSDAPLHADFSFNTFNGAAARQLGDLGARQVTLSLEVSLAQACAVRGAAGLPLEVIVHGSLPGMLLSQCLVAALTLDTTPDDPCPAPCQSMRFGLRDKLGQIHPIETDQYCRNHLLMGKDLCALAHLEPFLRAGFASLRLELPYATPAQVTLATTLYRRAIGRYARGERGDLISAQEFATLRQGWPRPFSLGGFAGAYQAVAQPDGDLPTNLVIQYDKERKNNSESAA